MFSIILIALTTFTMALLAVFVYLTNPTAKINYYFTLFTTLSTLWIISNFLENEPSLISEEHLSIFLRLDFILALFVFYAWFRFSYVFSRTSFRILENSSTYRVLLVIGVALAGLTSFSDYIINDISFESSIITFSNGTLWPFYALYILCLSLGGLVLLYYGRCQAKKTNTWLVKRQIDLVFIGFILSIGNALFINLILQTFFPISLEVSRLGIFGMVILIGFSSYAIVKHNFFDIRLILVRTITFLSFILLFIIGYSYLLTVFISAAFGENLSVGAIVTSIIFTTLAVIGFRPFYKYLSKYTNQIFYRGYYDPDKLLGELTHIMATDINVDTMTKKLLQLVIPRLQLSTVMFAILNKNRTFDIHYADAPSHQLTASEIEILVKIFHHQFPADTARPLLMHDFNEGPTKDFLRARNIGMIIPVQVGGENIAMFILGEKLSGEAYSEVDTPFLNIFANEAGIAIKNAQSYLEIKRFNEELEDLVKERTIQLESAQKQALKKAEDVAALKDEFVFLATHELRTPVTAIKLFLELTESEQDSLPPEFKKNLESITSANQHLEHLINDLLEIARSESHEIDFEIEPVDIYKTVVAVVDELHPLSEKRKLSISIADIDTDIYVYANKNKLREVITNLLSNAIKYNKEGGEVIIRFIDFDNLHIVEMKDTGIGIPSEQQAKIFQKFFRADSARTEKIIGTGLGMFITRMLVEKMGGTISFSSVQEVGTTTAFSLPKVINGG